MQLLAVYNLKGGVGKTATAVNLAYLSARDGYRTLLWDLDPQGAASFYFRIKPRIDGKLRHLIRGKITPEALVKGTDFERLDLLPADFSYRHMDLVLNETGKPERRLGRLLRPLAPQYDHLVLDCPPGISLVSESIFGVAGLLLVPLLPTPLSLRTFTQLRQYLKHQPFPDLSVLAFFTMVDRRKRLHREVCTAFLDRDDFLKTTIPYASVVERMGVEQAPLPHYAPRTEAAQAYEALWAELRGRLWKPAGPTT